MTKYVLKAATHYEKSEMNEKMFHELMVFNFFSFSESQCNQSKWDSVGRTHGECIGECYKRITGSHRCIYSYFQ